jgi:PadR family transcriptional regulator, regulatory protein PadR
VLRSLLLGFVRMHILHHAAEGPVYGVALMAELGRHGYRIGPGTLYPILHTLETQGFLRQDGQVVNGKVRKYYRATKSGEKILARAQAQLRELVDEVLPRTTPKGPVALHGRKVKPRVSRRPSGIRGRR